MPSSASRGPPPPRHKPPEPASEEGLQESGGAADGPRERHSAWWATSWSVCNLYWRSMVDRGHVREPAPTRRRLVVRLALFAFCGGLLLLLSSRPAEAAERREPGLLDPVRTTLKATAREVDSFAGRATGSRSSTVGQAGVARPAGRSTVQRGAPAVTSPVRRAAPPTS